MEITIWDTDHEAAKRAAQGISVALADSDWSFVSARSEFDDIGARKITLHFITRK